MDPYLNTTWFYLGSNTFTWLRAWQRLIGWKVGSISQHGPFGPLFTLPFLLQFDLYFHAIEVCLA